ncbi:hypothetical protein B0H14DRAFT_3887434 [Mycena olivaceomarginata]|nr:hypothetical protein B0H14DRAFT_3887434 [Mycena olivaceomarginata]
MLPPSPSFLSAITVNVCREFRLTRLPNPSHWSPELREAVINKFLEYLPVFVDDYKPSGFLAATSSEQELVKVISQAIGSRQVLWPSAPHPFQLYSNSPITSAVDLSSTLGEAEGRWGAASLARGWSPDGEAAYRLVCYGNVVEIIHNALQATPPYIVNVTRATGLARGGLAFGSTIAGGPGLLKDRTRLVRLQDSIRAWPDFDGQFPEPMRIRGRGVWRGFASGGYYSRREAFGIKIHSLSISVQFLAQTNPEAERSYFEDLHDIENEGQFWTLLAKAKALRVCCENCEEFIQHLIPEFAFVDVAKVQLERRKRDAMSWFERRWSASR